MNKKSEKEKHNYALTVAVVLTGVLTFFTISNWYFIISGNSLNSSFFTEIEETYNNQKDVFSKAWKGFGDK